MVGPVMKTLHVHLNGTVRGGHFHGRLHVALSEILPCTAVASVSAAKVGDVIMTVDEVEEFMNRLPRELVCLVLSQPDQPPQYQGVARAVLS